VLKEGGYEAVDSEPGFTAIRNVLKRAGPGR